MANPEHVEIVKQGADAVRAWREQDPDTPMDLSNASFFRARLRNMCLRDANLRNADLTEADLRESQLNQTDLTEAKLFGTNMRGAMLSEAKLHRADLRHVELDDSHISYSDLTSTSLIRASLPGSTLYKSNLSGADLRNANLNGACIGDVFLHDADLSEAILRQARLYGVGLGGARLIGADLFRSEFTRVFLWRTNLSRAKLGWNTFANTDLSVAIGLETTEHAGPSTVGVDTLFRSKEGIPESFLRNCGMSEEVYAHVASLRQSREYVLRSYSYFIAFNHADEEFCKRLFSRMRDEHLRVWLSPMDVESSIDYVWIENQMRLQDKVVPVLSDASIEDRWIEDEIWKATHREDSTRVRSLFPIRLAPNLNLGEWKPFNAGEEVDTFIPDFSNWRSPTDFEIAFQRLMDELREAAGFAWYSDGCLAY